MKKHIKKQQFLTLNILAILVFATLLPVFSELWKTLDKAFFFLLNDTLGEIQNSWNYLWAILSVRIFDLLPLMFILIFFMAFDKSKRLYELSFFVALLFLMLVVREIVDFFVEYFEFSRVSPSLVFESIRLSALYPDLTLKDSSGESFPGDHAAVLFVWFGFFVSKIKKFRFLALLMVLFFLVPRLISGAHWLSDVLVGGLGIALFTLALGLGTNILKPLNNLLFKIAKSIFNFIGIKV
jgi:membrane-associated phospholipid phosphatase